MEVVLHSENGILGMGPAPAQADDEDYDLINAGKQPVTLLDGGGVSSTIRRQFRDDARRPSRTSACWAHFRFPPPGIFRTGVRVRPAAIPAVGGAMDLAIGAKQTWVMMDLLTKKGESKLVRECTYPLTGIGCVSRVYSDLATFGCSPQGLKLIDKVDGLELAELERLVGLPIRT